MRYIIIKTPAELTELEGALWGMTSGGDVLELQNGMILQPGTIIGIKEDVETEQFIDSSLNSVKLSALGELDSVDTQGFDQQQQEFDREEIEEVIRSSLKRMNPDEESYRFDVHEMKLVEVDTIGYDSSQHDNLIEEDEAVIIEEVEPDDTNYNPDAANVSFSMDEDTSITITAEQLLANSSDINPSDTLTISNLNYTGTNGSLIDNGNGTWIFTPDTHWHGEVNFSFTVTDSDLTDTATVSLTVNPINDSILAISDINIADNVISESSQIGSQVGIKANAIDLDNLESEVTYSLVTENGEDYVGPFDIDSSTGVVKVSSVLDAEDTMVHSFVLKASSVDGTFSLSEVQTIKVIDVDETAVQAPTDVNTDENVVSEDAVAGTATGVTAQALDDATATHTFTISDADGNAVAAEDSAFGVDPVTGEVTVTNPDLIDAEAGPTMDVWVRVDSDDGTWDVQQFTINVGDVDEGGVTAASDTDESVDSVLENPSNGDLVGITAVATDDRSDTITYSISDESGNPVVNSAFAIDPVTGVVTVADATQFDHENADQMTFYVRSDSSDGTFSVQDFVVDVVDVNETAVQAPTDVNTDENVVSEDAVAGTATGVTAQALDDATATHTFTISDADGNAVAAEDSAFGVDPVTGEVTVTNPDLIDAEAGPTMDVWVRVDSDDGTWDVQQFTINVGDVDEGGVTAASDTDESVDSVLENPSNGDLVGITAVATDDRSDTITYSISDESGNPVVNSAFAIDPVTGVVTVADATQFDHENADQMTFYVRSDSSDGTFSVQDFVVDVVDVNETAVQAPTDVNTDENVVSEDAVAGTATGVTAQALDDATATHTFTISDADGNAVAAEDSAFGVDPVTGEVTVTNPDLIDAEAGPTMDVWVRVDSDDGTWDVQQFTINVGDVDEGGVTAASDTDESVDSVLENPSNGDLVGITAVATDDRSDTITYSISDESGNPVVNSAFAIDPVTGVVTVADATQFDHENADQMTFYVRSDSSDGTFSVQDFVVDVVDVNETAVQAPTDVNTDENVVSEDAVAGTATGVTAQALDDATATHTFTISDADGNAVAAEDSAFGVDPVTGEVTVTNPDLIDAEAGPTMDVWVRVDSDDGTWDVQQFTINVGDVDEGGVTAASDTDESVDSVLENPSNGDLVGITAVATDDRSDTITYSISDESGNPVVNSAFAIDPVTGVVTVADATQFDHENADQMTFYVRSDSSDGTFSVQDFVVDVVDVNETAVQAPTDVNTDENVVSEDAVAGTATGVTAQALDDATATHTFTISDADGNAVAAEDSAFGVDPVTGEVTVTNPDLIDAEAGPTMDVWVRVDSDDGTWDVQQFTINVGDVDEGGVTAASDTDESVDSVLENPSNGDLVGITAVATDDRSDTITYSISDESGNPVVNSAFAIDPVTGVVTVADATQFDHENADQMTFYVRSDSSDGTFSVQDFVVDVVDVNETAVQAPTDVNTDENVVSEDAVAGTATGVTAQALDDATATHTFTISDADGNAVAAEDSAFGVDPVTGEVTVTNPDLIDAEAGPTMDVWVRVDSDDGTWDVQQFTINVGDVDEGGVTAASDTDESVDSVLENPSNGDLVGITAVATDDRSDTITYSISDESGNPVVNSAFAIDPVTGVVTVADATQFDHENADQMTFYVRSDSSDGTFSVQDFVVDVVDVNETAVQAPTDVNTDENVVSEDAVAGTATGVTAQALDDATATHTFTISDADGNAVAAEDSAFGVDPVTGEVTVTNPDLIDAEAGPTMDVWVRVDSDDGTWDVQQFTINVGDVDEGGVTAASDTDESVDSVLENPSNGDLVGITAVATDDRSDTITYSISDESGNPVVNSAFAIDPVTGVVTVADATQFDHENADQMTFYVRSDSSDGTFSVQDFVVDVVDVNETAVQGEVELNGDEDTPILITQADLLNGATDIEGDDLTALNLSIDESFGALVDNNDGTWIFTPVENSNGVVALAFDISDGTDTTHATGNLTVDALNDVPELTGAINFTVQEDEELVLTEAEILANVMDVEGDTLSIVDMTTTDDNTTIVNNGNGTWSIWPDDNFTGLDNLELTVSDGTGQATFEATATVEGVADEPFLALALNTTPIHDFTVTQAGWQDPAVWGWATDNHGGDGGAGFNNRIEVNWAEGTYGVVGGDASHGTVIELEGYSNDVSNLWKNIDVVAGETFTIEFDISGRNNLGPQSNHIILEFEGQEIDQMIPEVGFETVRYTLTATEDNPRFEFRAAVADGAGALIDSITVRPAEIQANEGDTVNFNIDTSLADTDGSETLTTAITGIPDGWVLSDGVNTFNSIADNSTADTTGWDQTVITATPPTDWNGFVQLIAESTATEASGDTATNSINIPIRFEAVNDDVVIDGENIPTFNVDEDVVITITEEQLLANASDVDGDNLTVTNLSVDNAIVNTIINGDGSRSYQITPNENFNGMTNINYDVSDGAGGDTVSGATLVVRAVNDGPTVGAPFINGFEDTVLVITEAQLLAGSTDIDGDTLSVVNMVHNDGNGALVGNGDGTWSFTPDANFNGNVTLQFEVSDGEIQTATAARLTFANTNDAPTVTPLMQVTDEDTAFTLTQAELLATATDLDGDALTATNLQVMGPNATVVDNGDGTFTVTPAANFNGNLGISFDISDGTDVVGAIMDVTVNPLNDIPTIVGAPIVLNSMEDTAQMVTTAELLANVMDADGDMLTVQNLTSADATIVDNGDGTYIITPNANVNGNITLAYEVNDGTGVMPTVATLTLVAVNDTPDFQATTLNGTEDDVLTFTNADLLANVTDVDGDTVTVTSVTYTGTDGNLVDNGDGTYTFTPNANWNGNTNLDVSYSDGTTNINEDITLSITSVNDAPVATPVTNELINSNESITFTSAQLLANVSDVEGDSLSIDSVTYEAGNGTLVDNGDDTWTFTPNAQHNGIENLQVTVTDGNDTTIYTQAIDVNAAIQAVQDGRDLADVINVTVQESADTHTFDVLANDINSDGDVLSITNLTEAVDTDGNVLGTLRVVIVDGREQVEFTPDGSLSLGETKEINFEYTVSDGRSSSTSNQSFFLEGEANAITDKADELALTTNEDTAVVITLEQLATGINNSDGNPLTVSNLATTNGTIVDNGDDTFTFTPAENFNGDVDITFDISDGTNTFSENANITVNSINDAVVAVDDIHSDEIATGTFAAGDSLNVTTNVSETAFSAGFWFRSDDQIATTTLFEVREVGGGGGADRSITLGADGTVTSRVWQGAVEELTSGPGLDDGQWHHVTMTMGPAGGQKLYIDGVEVADGAFASSNFNWDGSINIAPDFAGDIRDVQVYDQELTAAEVQGIQGGAIYANLNTHIDFSGDQPFTDQQGNTVTVIGAPTAIDNGVPITTTDVATFDINVLANDTDVEGDTISITNLSAVTDNGGNVIGTVAVVNIGGIDQVRFTPAANVAELDTDESMIAYFTYTADDGNGGQSTANVEFEITGTNQGPTVTGNIAHTTDEDVAITLTQADLLANASDIDGDTLVANNVQLVGTDATLTDNGDGTYTVTPNQDWNGDIDLTYDVTDGDVTVSTGLDLTVTPVQDNPVAVDDANVQGTMSMDGTGFINMEVGSNTGRHTTSMWIRTGEQKSMGLSHVTGETGTASDRSLWIDEDGIVRGYVWGGAAGLDYLESTTTNLSDNEWHHIVMTSGPDGTKLYIDGVLEDTSPIQTAYTSSTRLYLGEAEPNNDSGVIDDIYPHDNFEGRMRDVQIYDTEADQADVDTLNDWGVLDDPIIHMVFDPADPYDNGQGRDDYTITNSGAATFVTEYDSDGFTVQQNQDLVFDVLADDYDPDGDTLSITNVGTVTDRDGNVLGTAAVIQVDGRDQVEFTQADNLPNLRDGEIIIGNFEYTIDDGNGNTDTAIAAFNIVGINDPAEIIENFNIKTENEDTTFTITTAEILAGFNDPDGDVLSVGQFNETTGNATVVDNGDGTWTVTPGANWAGELIFNTTVSDSLVLTNGNLRVTVGEVADAATLSLDNPNFAGLDQELITNGTLDGNTGWTFTGTGNQVQNFDNNIYFGAGGDFAGGVAQQTFTVAEGGLTYTTDFDHTHVGGGVSTGRAEILDDTGTVIATLNYENNLGGGNTVAQSFDWVAPTAGNYTIRFTNFDDDNLWDHSLDNISVMATTAGNPTVDPNTQIRADEDTTVALNITNALTDLDGSETAAYELTGAAAGATITDGVNTTVSDGSNIDVSGWNLANLSFTPATNQSGNVALTLVATVTETASGDQAVTNLPINIYFNPINDAATVGADIDRVIDEDNSITLTQAELLANSSDPDGDALTASNLVVTAGNATVTDNLDGTYTITPDANFAGDIDVSFDVSDGTVTTPSKINLTVNSVNDAPVITGDAVQNFDEDTGFVITQAMLLQNSSDPDGEALVATLDGIPAGATVNVAGAEITNNNDGTYSVTPNANFNGLINFAFTVSDGQVTSASNLQLTVDSVNDAPVVAADVAATTDEDNSFTLTQADLLVNSSDVDGDALTALNLVADANASIVNNGDGTYTVTPDADYNGSITISYDVSDGTATVGATVNVTVNPVVDAITVGAPMINATEDVALLITEADLLQGSTDPDGLGLSVENVTTADPGTLTDNGDGTWTFEPAANFNGNITLSYDVMSQGVANPTAARLAFASVNDAPEVTPLAANMNEDTMLVLTQADLLANSTDADGDALTATNVQLTGASVGNAMVTDMGGGNWEIIPNADFNGDLNFTFDVSDGTATTHSTLTVTVDPVADGITVMPGQLHGMEGVTRLITTAELIAGTTNPDNLPLTVNNVTTADAGTLVDNLDGTWSFTPTNADWNGNITLNYNINDGISDTFNVTRLTFHADVEGTAQDDILTGNDNWQYDTDFIYGEAGADTISGGTGDDTLFGGSGDDTLTGGTGSDTFAFMFGDEGTVGTPAEDTITDFEVGTDHIDISDFMKNHTSDTGVALANLVDLREESGNTIISLKSDGTHIEQEITVENTTLNEFYGGDTTGISEADILQKMIDDNNLIS